MRRLIAVVVAVLVAWLVFRARTARDEPAPDPSAPRELTIATRENEVLLSLRHDSVVMRLSDSTLARARADLDTSRAGADSGGVAARFENLVKSTVGKALEHQIAVPVEKIEEIRYENGAIVMRVEDGPRWLNFESVKVGSDRPVLESFPPDDARRFVAAVQAARARHR